MDVNDSTLEQYRETEAEIRARIRSYAYPRRSEEKLKRDKETLRQMSKLDKRVSPTMAGAPGMQMGIAVEMHLASLESPKATHNRAIASAGGKAKNRRTRNQ